MAAYQGHYIKQADLEARLSAAVVKRIYDDNNLGAAEETPLSQLIKDAEAKFEGYCRGIYDLAALRLAKPNEAVRMCLDIAEAFAAKRFPRAYTRDWQPLMDFVDRELKRLRTSETRLDIASSPEPAANVGGKVLLFGGKANSEDNDPSFTSGFGIF
jgi:phage gp36-like protein